MKRDVILAGVGGQGLLALAAVLGETARSLGLFLKQAEVHGMAQRGGIVQSHVRYGDQPVHSDLVQEGSADVILSLEPMEALRYLPFLAPDGIVITNAVPFVNIPNYPDADDVLSSLRSAPRHLLVDAVSLAKSAGSSLCANMVMLGAGSPFLELPDDALREAVRRVFGAKSSAVIEQNLRGYELGRQFAAQCS